MGGGAGIEKGSSQALASPSKHDPLLSWFPVLPGRGGNRLLESRRNPHHLWRLVGRVDHHGAYALRLLGCVRKTRHLSLNLVHRHNLPYSLSPMP